MEIDYHLTPRELDILKLASNGMSHKQIALELGIARQTIKNHATKLFLKLRANNMVHAVATALRERIIT